jgi:hypothetical protein
VMIFVVNQNGSIGRRSVSVLPVLSN